MLYADTSTLNLPRYRNCRVNAIPNPEKDLAGRADALIGLVLELTRGARTHLLPVLRVFTDPFDQSLNAIYDAVPAVDVVRSLIPDLLELLRILGGKSRHTNTCAGQSCGPFAAQQKICSGAECAKY